MIKNLQNNTNEINFREILDSEKMNNMMNDINKNIISLLNEYQILEDSNIKMLDIKNIENDYFIKSVNKMEQKLEILNIQYEELNLNSSYKTLSIYPKEIINISSSIENQSNIITDFNSIILPFLESEDKLKIEYKDQGLEFIPDETDIVTTILTENVILETENNILNSISKDEVYYQVFKTTQDINFINLEYEFTLPIEIIESNDVNAISFEAFPFNSVDIIDIEYNDFGVRRSIKCLDRHPESSIEIVDDTNYYVIKDSKKMLFNFTNLKSDKIYIKVRQTNFILDGNYRKFYVGIKDIKILNMNFNKRDSTFYSKVIFNVPGEKTLFEVSPVLNNPNYANNDDVIIDIYLLDELDNLLPTTESFPLKISNNKFMIKGTIKRALTTPNVNKLVVKYS